MRLIKIAQVATVTRFTKKNVWDSIEKGFFPKPVEFDDRFFGWPEDEVNAMVEAWSLGASSNQIMRLVDAMHKKREEKLKYLIDGFSWEIK